MQTQGKIWAPNPGPANADQLCPGRDFEKTRTGCSHRLLLRRAEYNAQEENNLLRSPGGAVGAAKGGENSKYRQNTPLTVPNPRFGDAELELRLRELRPVFFRS